MHALTFKDYARKNPKTKSNYMDMNTGAGYAFSGTGMRFVVFWIYLSDSMR